MSLRLLAVQIGDQKRSERDIVMYKYFSIESINILSMKRKVKVGLKLDVYL